MNSDIFDRKNFTIDDEDDDIAMTSQQHIILDSKTGNAITDEGKLIAHGTQSGGKSFSDHSKRKFKQSVQDRVKSHHSSLEDGYIESYNQGEMDESKMTLEYKEDNLRASTAGIFPDSTTNDLQNNWYGSDDPDETDQMMDGGRTLYTNDDDEFHKPTGLETIVHFILFILMLLGNLALIRWHYAPTFLSITTMCIVTIVSLYGIFMKTREHAAYKTIHSCFVASKYRVVNWQ